MATRILIDPLTRIEGHLKIEVEVEGGKVVKAWSAGEMFRGWEKLLVGRNPVDAQQITMRICGVCPADHGQASTFCLDDAFGIIPPKNGRLARNLMLGANYFQSHILHFYHLTALDYVDIAAIAQYKGADRELQKVRDWVVSALDQGKAGEPVPVGPFLPRYDGPWYVKDVDTNIVLIKHYLQALKARRVAHEMVAIFGGRMPHQIGIVPGGLAQPITSDRVTAYKMRLLELIDFVDNVYYPDILAVAKTFPETAKMGKSYGNYLAFGLMEESDDGKKRWFPSGVVISDKLEELDPAKIVEFTKYSSFKDRPGKDPYNGITDPDPNKKGAYTWLKAPRYNNLPMEVGPAARLAVAYKKGVPDIKAAMDAALKDAGAGFEVINSELGRHLARAVECKSLAHKLMDYVDQLEPGKPQHTPFTIPKEAKGMGLTEAARGALGHWIVIKDGKIANYQAVVPTTWNASPRDDKGVEGPIEKSLMGQTVSDPKNPMELARIVRSFDPCLACAVHVYEGGKEMASFRVS